METKTPKWVTKALGILNLSEEGKLLNFYDYLVKEYKKGISTRKTALYRLENEYNEELARQEEILVEITEDLQTISSSVDVEKISKRGDREEYFKTFDLNLSNAMQNVSNQKEYIKSITTTYKKEVEKLNKEITIFEEKLVFFED